MSAFSHPTALYLHTRNFILCFLLLFIWGFPGGSDGKESASNAGDLGPIRELGRPP